ncbi:MAG: WYL domain-containing protein [Actinomycetales bacterium]|nr:WYL domain-containing protein [Actinomycetales bacterium]
MVERQKYDAAGRLFSILAALLLAGDRGLTKAELFQVVEAYANDRADGIDPDALEKKFDRDKNHLRDNGFSLTIRSIDDDERYVIPQKNFAFPELLELSPRQIQLLNIASEIWAQSAFSSDAGRAAIRLRGLGFSTSTDSLMNVAPRIQVHDPAFMSLADAITNHYVVEFQYRKPGVAGHERREVEPWALKNIQSQWLLQCFDRDRQEVRNFLLKRIVSSVKPVLEAGSEKPIEFDGPSQEQLDLAAEDLRAITAAQVAVISVRNGSEAWFHFTEDSSGASETTDKAEWIERSLNYMDAHLLAEEIRSYGPDIRVIEPSHLADIVRAGFEQVIADHA